MHCKAVDNGFGVKTETKTTVGDNEPTKTTDTKTYYAVALFGDRTDAIILLCTTLIFGVIMVFLLLK